ncbi:hypothetical protein GQ472_06775 [archaeon]|nr:hypothetical protein [archaeon]
MNSTPMANFDRPLPIGADELSYLKDRLWEANIESFWGEVPKEYHSIHPAIGTIVVYNNMNTASNIRFSPSGWSRLYEQNMGDILKDLSGIIPNYNLPCEIRTIYSDKFGKDDSFKPYLTFNIANEPQLALDTECVKIFSEEGINVLQTVWNRMIGRFNKESISLAEQFKLPKSI